jgi:hypothetical protein
MPRQLPWVNAIPKSPRARVASEIDDNFFDGTPLETTRKGKERAHSSSQYLDSGHCKGTSLSSPPVADLSSPRPEYMHTGVSKFDLHDDEWMMVEDELLETAKLFTRHLHIAEYKRLKQSIEQKKQTDARPVVAKATVSAETATKEKARMQTERQREAFRDVFALLDDSDKPPIMSAPVDTDSEDLDAPLRSSRSIVSRPTALNPGTSSFSSISNPSSSQIVNRPSLSLVKPSLAQPETMSRVKGSSTHRATPFDMLDDYMTQACRLKPVAAAKSERAEQPIWINNVPLQSKAIDNLCRVSNGHKKLRRSHQLIDDWSSEKTHGNSEVGKETPDPLAKRTVRREENRSEKRKAGKLDDVPTFLI